VRTNKNIEMRSKLMKSMEVKTRKTTKSTTSEDESPDVC
jgi:hypothetical protein